MPPVSRRHFARLLALGAAGTAVPWGGGEFALAGAHAATLARRDDAIWLNSNEYPTGPHGEALSAIRKIAERGNRYLFDETGALKQTLAEQEGVTPDHVLIGAGSSDLLYRCVLAFTGPQRAMVLGEPGYEPPTEVARAIGTPVREVPLTAALAHDPRAMLAADGAPGLLYVCNPNNPTGTITARADLEWLVANKPEGAIVLVDEAYIHFTEEAPATDLVAAGKDVVVLRTFSKLYGLAGIRCGAAIARPDLIKRLGALGLSPMPITGVAAAHACLRHGSLVADRRRAIREAREETFAALEKQGMRFHRSVSNCFMLETGRPARAFAEAMAARGIMVGRSWPAWPTMARITVGTRDEMRKFVGALRQVLA